MVKGLSVQEKALIQMQESKHFRDWKLIHKLEKIGTLNLRDKFREFVYSNLGTTTRIEELAFQKLKHNKTKNSISASLFALRCRVSTEELYQKLIDGQISFKYEERKVISYLALQMVCQQISQVEKDISFMELQDAYLVIRKMNPLEPAIKSLNVLKSMSARAIRDLHRFLVLGYSSKATVQSEVDKVSEILERTNEIENIDLKETKILIKISMKIHDLGIMEKNMARWRLEDTKRRLEEWQRLVSNLASSHVE